MADKIKLVDLEQLTYYNTKLQKNINTRFGNVDNTHDADKPISTATQTALDNISSSVSTLDNNSVKKTGQTSQIIAGDITVQGDFTVSGTTTTLGTETLLVKDNLVVTNSDGAVLADLSGLAIKINGTDVFGILYDPANGTVKLGKGTVDANGKFSFALNEGFAVATRDDSSNLTSGHLIAWDGTKFILTDSGTSVSDLRDASKLDAGTVPVARLPQATIVTAGITTLGATGGAARFGNKNDVGLSDVDNTADMNKPVSTATQAALNLKVNNSDLSDVAKSGNYSDLTGTPTTLPNPAALTFGTKTYDGSATKTITKDDLGLNNVDNTSDNTKKTNFTGTIAENDGGFVTGEDVYSALVNKVDKETGKGLSTNDLTNDLKSNYDAAYTDKHTHSNKGLLDSYNQTNADLTDAVTQKHTHTNKDVLDGITSDKVSSWNSKQSVLTFDTTPTADSNNPVYSKGIKSALDELDNKIKGITGGGVVTGVKGDGETTYRDGNVNITAENIGLGNVENKSVATIKTELTGQVASGNTGFTTGDVVHSAIANFITKTVNDLVNYYTKTEIDSTVSGLETKISAIPKFAIKVVTTLPTSDISSTTVYLVKTKSTSGDLYTEYIYVNNAWEELGTQTVDLTGYATETWVNTQIKDFKTETEINTLITSKLADYTKRSELATIATSGKLSDAEEDGTHRLVTTYQIAVWDNKQDTLKFDSTPTADSKNPVTSGGIKTALDNIKQVEVLNVSITGDPITSTNTSAMWSFDLSSEDCEKALNTDIDCKIRVSYEDGQILELLRTSVATDTNKNINAQFATYDIGNNIDLLAIIQKTPDNTYTKLFSMMERVYTAKDVGLGNVANVLQYSAENKVPLTSGVDGILPAENGGTGASSYSQAAYNLANSMATTTAISDSAFVLLLNDLLGQKITFANLKSALSSTPYTVNVILSQWVTASSSSDTIIAGLADYGTYCCKIPAATHGKTGQFTVEVRTTQYIGTTSVYTYNNCTRCVDSSNNVYVFSNVIPTSGFQVIIK